jgi:predicted GH43/DUF377 family glycosyl hydrolase
LRTINEALALANEGDTILIAQGTYTENLLVESPLKLMGGYAATTSAWTRDIVHYETIVASDDRTVPGDWNGDWLGSPCVIKYGAAYRMWYSGGNEIAAESIGYADSPDGVNWFKPVPGPVLIKGALDEWDGAGVANPSVLATGGGFQMWYAGLNVAGQWAIGHATSPDGLTWQKHDGNPVLHPDSLDQAALGFPSVVQDGAGGYKMWYSGGGRIWVATSPDGLSWTKYLTAPALAPGLPGAWDDDRVYAPRVVAGAGGYEMWYTGAGTETPGPSIGYAWSDDGLNWTKSPHNPVLAGAADGWETGESACPTVVKEGAASYQMWYRGGTNSERAFGQATSGDGVVWEKYDHNPVLSGGRPTRWGSSVVTLGRDSAAAVLDGLTITGGFARYGGGVYLSGDLPVIRNCKVISNSAWIRGGGIYAAAGAPLIEHTVVSGNTSGGGWAGGIYVGYASPTIVTSLITHNVAREGGGGLAIWNSSDLVLTATTVANNTGVRGGGIDLSSSILHIRDSRIGGNAAIWAAGLRVRYSTLAMTNTFVVDNHATGEGPGALGFWRSCAKLVNVTIAANSADDGAGGISFGTDQPGENLHVLNSIIAFNGIDDLDCSSGTCEITYSDVQQGLPGEGNISADPKFVDLVKGDYHLKGNSPAIDAGTSDGAPAADFEGDPRSMGAVDMGADEFTGVAIEDTLVFLPLVLRGF